MTFRSQVVSFALAIVPLLLTQAGCSDKAKQHTPAEQSSNVIPPDDMVVVPAGDYVVTAPHLAKGEQCTPEVRERLKSITSGPAPQASQPVAAFAIDKQRVSCRDFRDCRKQHVCPDSDWGDHDCEDSDALATREQAIAYCAWRGHVLPTYLQWQAAVRGPDGPRVLDAECLTTGPAEDKPCIATSRFGVKVSTSIHTSEFTRSEDCSPMFQSLRPWLASAIELRDGNVTRLQVDVGSPEVGDEKHPMQAFFRCADDSTVPRARISK